MSCKELAKLIRTDLKKKTGRSWSVRTCDGSSYGWFRICAPAKRLDMEGNMVVEDREALTKSLGLEYPAHRQMVLISPDNTYLISLEG